MKIKHLDRQAGGRQDPDRHRREHPVRSQRHPGGGIGAPPGAQAGDHGPAPDPRPHHQQRRAEVERGMGEQRRIEGVEHGAGARQNRQRGGHRADDGNPEAGPRPAQPDHPAQRRLDHEVAESHDEERGEHQRLEDTVRCDRQVVEARGAERELHAGAGERLHHRHHAADGEGGHRDPDVREHEPGGWRHRRGSTTTVPCIRW